MATEQRKPESDRRITVWVCYHLWMAARAGEPQALEIIARNASDRDFLDGRRVAVCQACENYDHSTPLDASLGAWPDWQGIVENDD